MYLGITTIVTRRKTSKCSNGGCTLGDIPAGELAIAVVRKSRKGRSYRVFHFPCFLGWAMFMYRRRKEFLAKHPSKRAGRPTTSSVVKKLFEDNPELAQERHKCIRSRARLMRYLLVADDKEKRARLVGRIKALDDRIKAIMPLQVEQPGRRSAESREELGRRFREHGER